MYIDIFIKGIPYGQWKVKGDLTGPKIWTETIVINTRDFPKIKKPSMAHIVFILPAEKYPKDHPFGPDLDNLLKRLFDALNQTILSEAKGQDGIIVEVIATKHKAAQKEEAGVKLSIIEMTNYFGS
ncbi:MAG: RusA family crossover junction endodeoxyribonuclease [Dehalococcoidia bacterium]|jgi:Holliday junction resolvase RusA-like endonuclease